MSQSKIIGAVEIGTSKVAAVVGEIHNDSELNIIGFGQSTSRGVKKGVIVDLPAVCDCTHAALNTAEKTAKAEIEDIYMSVTGAHLKGFLNRGAATVASPEGIVSKSDIQEAAANAKRKEAPDGRAYIHFIQNGFFIDDKPVEKPVSMQGEIVEVSYWNVHGDERVIGDQLSVINGININVQDLILSSIASGSILATEAEKQTGCMVADIGAGTTDFALYKDGRIMRTGVIPVGGDHITNDLALGLRVGLRHANSLKEKFAKAIVDKSDKNDKVWLSGDLSIGDRQISRGAIYQITHARVEELFMIMKNRLNSLIGPKALPGGIILTGGVSRLPMIEECAKRTLGVEARLGVNEGVRSDLRQPEFSTALGLLYHGLSMHRSPEARKSRSSLFGRVARKIFSMS